MTYSPRRRMHRRWMLLFEFRPCRRRVVIRNRLSAPRALRLYLFIPAPRGSKAPLFLIELPQLTEIDSMSTATCTHTPVPLSTVIPPIDSMNPGMRGLNTSWKPIGLFGSALKDATRHSTLTLHSLVMSINHIPRSQHLTMLSNAPQLGRRTSQNKPNALSARRCLASELLKNT